MLEVEIDHPPYRVAWKAEMTRIDDLLDQDLCLNERDNITRIVPLQSLATVASPAKAALTNSSIVGNT